MGRACFSGCIVIIHEVVRVLFYPFILCKVADIVILISAFGCSVDANAESTPIHVVYTNTCVILRIIQLNIAVLEGVTAIHHPYTSARINVRTGKLLRKNVHIRADVGTRNKRIPTRFLSTPITEDIADVSWFFRPFIFPNALIVINYYSIIQSLDSSLSNTGVIRIIKCDDILVIGRDLVSYFQFPTQGAVGYVAI